MPQLVKTVSMPRYITHQTQTVGTPLFRTPCLGATDIPAKALIPPGQRRVHHILPIPTHSDKATIGVVAQCLQATARHHVAVAAAVSQASISAVNTDMSQSMTT
eukprot:GHUV01034698.1.p1 GENE.GHUV01034698.1~~GHUV01034698.1.p1  ORF type:complete len:104 (-),score=16.90 GHUV01034698.1:133-444(-)